MQYTRELSHPRYKPLDKEGERVLFYQYKDGDKKALDLIVISHLRFVVYLLGNYKIPRSLDALDLIQEGNLGLITSIPRFDADKYSCRIATYSQFWIRFFINKALSLKEKTNDTIISVEDISELGEGYVVDSDGNFDIREGATADIKHILSTLDSREAKVVSLLFGLEYPFQPRTLKEVGTMLHIHAERVRGIKNDAIDKLKISGQALSLYPNG
jgi:RNA polymerase sigma factor (sigma-70 family)